MFTHHVVDNAIPLSFIEAVIAETPHPASEIWHGGSLSGVGANRIGRGRKTWAGPPRGVIREACNVLGHVACGIVGDHAIDLGYAGLFQMEPGSELSAHRDLVVSTIPGHERRWNVLLFLTRPVGGEMELWNGDQGQIEVIEPLVNRMVIFEMNEISWHAVRTVDVGRRLTLAVNLAAPGEPGLRSMTWWEDEHVRT